MSRWDIVSSKKDQKIRSCTKTIGNGPCNSEPQSSGRKRNLSWHTTYQTSQQYQREDSRVPTGLMCIMSSTWGLFIDTRTRTHDLKMPVMSS
ncbi:hypothetical protein TNCV_1403961 [Trichonephila clavipes]|nr:hypothetical protein TNCV_1403961 [Trichonephila clavipes]